MPAGTNEYLLWCCLSNEPDNWFPVKVNKRLTVGELKRAIKQEKHPELDDIAPDHLTLWIVSIPIQDLQERQEVIRNPEITQGITPLRLTTSLLRIFTGKNAPKDEHLHIIAQRPTEPRKRPRFESDEREKYPQRGVPRSQSLLPLPKLDDYEPVIAKLKGIRQWIMEEVPDNPAFYADPARVISLPFPSHNRVPRRFNMSKDKTFSFMGRERFAEVWQTWSQIKSDSRYRQAMYIYGSMGYGKSHILAALVCLLIRSGERVVYVPDCAEAIRGPLPHMKMAFLFAFCDYPVELKKIAAWRTLKDIEDFCEMRSYNGVKLCFVIDQINALDQQAQNEDNHNDHRKQLDEFLHAASAGHLEIYSASANVNSYNYTRRKQTNDLKIIMLGGMTENEMEHWWQRYDNAFTEPDKRRIEDLTGRIPLFLLPFLDKPKGPLRSLEPDIWKHSLFDYVQQEVQSFAWKHLVQNTEALHIYMKLMRSCLGGFTSSELEVLLDHRWFYLSDGHVHCTLGLARESMMSWLCEHARGDIFLSVDWLTTVEANKDKPTVIGSIVEKMIIGKVSNGGLCYDAREP